MRTAVDTNVLLDVFVAGAPFQERSIVALDRAATQGSLVACEIVVGEVAGQFSRLQDAVAAFARASLQFLPSTIETAHAAGRGWVAYRRRGGKRERIVADFLVGAHALHQADALLTRDRGYYGTYFPRLKLIVP